MDDLRPDSMEMRLADLIWEHAPIHSGDLLPLAAEAFGWKKSTMYTMLRRLCQRGIFQNENGLVTALMSREDWDSRYSQKMVKESFGGSLPRFLTAFCSRNSLTDKEIQELQALIDEQRRK